MNPMIEVAGLGTVPVDVAWGGMAYAIVSADALGFSLTPDEGRDLCAQGQTIKQAAAEQLTAVHPENPGFAGITQTEFAGPLRRDNGTLTARNAVVVSPGCRGGGQLPSAIIWARSSAVVR